MDWALKPSGLEAGDRFRLLFLSSTKRNAESADITDYNSFVQDLAAAGHPDIRAYASQFRAVACTSAANAIDNTGTTGTGVPTYWLNGAKAADNYADFYDGSWDEEVTVRNESGTSVNARQDFSTLSAWVGCEHEGTAGFDDSGTSGSIVLGTTEPGVGTVNYTIGSSPGPLDQNEDRDPKASVNHLYGISPTFVVKHPPPEVSQGVIPVDWALKPSGLEAGDRFRLLFLSSTQRNAESADITDYNSFVQGLTAAGHAAIQPFASQFRAVACTAAVDARDNTTTMGTGVRIYWLGGAQAADSYPDFYDGSWDEEVTVRNESGTAVTIPNSASTHSAWTGCEHDGTEGMNADGSIALGTTGPSIGILNYTGTDRGPLNQEDGTDPKASKNYLYGLSPVLTVMPPTPVEVPLDWSLTPSGLEAGDRFRLLFLSSTDRNAESTDIADYNTFVQTRVAAGHTDIQDYSSQFRAVACTEAVDARYNTGTTGTGVRIYWLGGAQAADSYPDFYDGSWDEEVTVRDESATSITMPNSASTYSTWTGCEKDGTEGINADGSIALGTTGPGIGILNYTGTDRGPLNQEDGTDPKASKNYLYGLSPIFLITPQTPVEVPVDWTLKPSDLESGKRFRLLFISSTDRNAESTDIADYNTFVQTRAAAGHADIQDYASQFRAVACTEAVDARYNTGTTGTGVRIYWIGGAQAADSYPDFYDSSWDEEVTVRNESGTAVTIPNTASTYSTWTGCEHDGTKGMNADGSIALGTTGPSIGILNYTGTDRGPLNQEDGTDPKASKNYLYGLSPVFIMEETTVPTVVPDQGPVLVKNTGQTPSTQVWALNDNVSKRAQAFTTGPDASYSLSSIGFRFDDIADTSAAGDELAVKLTSNNRGNPGTTLCTLTDPSTFSSNAVNTFDAPVTCPTLARNTTYFALIERTTVTTNIVLKVTGSNNEDSGAAAGWSISNGRVYFQDSSWRDFSTQSHQIVVSGTSDGPPPLTVNFEHENYSVAEGDSIGINVTLSNAPDQQVTITVGRSSPNGATASDYSYTPGQLTFNSGETNQTITFTANVDTAVDDGEQVVFTIIGTPTGVITGLRNQATVTIVDTQDPEVTVSFDQAAYSVTEGNTVTVRVNLSEDPDRNVTIPLTKVNQNGATADDYSGVPSTVTFSDGTTQSSFTFRAATDADHENDESVLIGFSTLPAKVTAGPTNQTTVAITEAPPVNRPPEVSATASTTSVYSGETVTLDGNAADPDDDALTYRWTSDAGGIFDPDPGILDTAWLAPAIGTAYTAAPHPDRNRRTWAQFLHDHRGRSATTTCAEPGHRLGRPRLRRQRSLPDLDSSQPAQPDNTGQRAGPTAKERKSILRSRLGHHRHATALHDGSHGQWAGREHDLPFPHTLDQHDQHLRRFRTRRRQNSQESSGATALRHRLVDADQHHPELVQYRNRCRIQAGIPQRR